MRAKIRNTELYFDVDGMGLVPDGERMAERPVLFLLHGGPGAAHNYTLRIAGLAAQGRPVIHYDQLGIGNSTHLPGEGEEYRVIAPVDLRLTIHKDHDRYRLVGTVKTQLELDCSRCVEVR